MLGGGSALTTPDLAAPSLLPQERLKPSARWSFWAGPPLRDSPLEATGVGRGRGGRGEAVQGPVSQRLWSLKNLDVKPGSTTYFVTLRKSILLSFHFLN